MPERRIGTALAAVGAVLTAAGTALYVLPGPGFPVLVTGLAAGTAGLVVAVAGRAPAAGATLRASNGVVTDTRRRWRFVGSVTAWWVLLALVLWLLGKALDRPSSLAACAASAALLVAVGEVGEGLRRRLRARRRRP